MTLKEAIVQLPWSEIGLRQAILSYINMILNHLGMMVFFLLIIILLIEAAKYATYFIRGPLMPLLKRSLLPPKKQHCCEFLLRYYPDYSMKPFLSRLGYLAGGIGLILGSYAIVTLFVSFITPSKNESQVNDWSFHTLCQNTDVPAETIRFYLIHLGLVMTSLVILTGILVMLSSVGGRWLRSFAGFVMAVFIILGLCGGFFNLIVNCGR